MNYMHKEAGTREIFENFVDIKSQIAHLQIKCGYTRKAYYSLQDAPFAIFGTSDANWPLEEKIAQTGSLDKQLYISITDLIDWID